MADQYVCGCGCEMFLFERSIWHKDQTKFKCESCKKIITIQHKDASNTPMRVWLEEGDKVLP